MRLDQDRRKAFRQLADAGFRVEPSPGTGEVKVTAPNGEVLGKYAVPNRSKDTPIQLVRRVKIWARQGGASQVRS